MPFANNNGVKIHYEVEGQGPPLILQHGLMGSLERWRIYRYAQELKKDYRLILVDARGHGQSDRPHEPEAYTYERFASDYVAILDDLGIQKANYFGYSMGAAIGFKGIARYTLPHFNSLILGGINPTNTTPEPERQFWNVLINGMQLAIREGWRAWIADYEKRYGRPYDQRLVPTALANDPVALLAIGQRLADGMGVEEILPKINVPCLVFAGTADAFHPGAKEAVVRMPKATFVSFPGLDHVGCFASTDLVLPHVKKFLTEVNKR
jgi:pimeloyl-ACP methyl ester carboxylesterase